MQFMFKVLLRDLAKCDMLKGDLAKGDEHNDSCLPPSSPEPAPLPWPQTCHRCRPGHYLQHSIFYDHMHKTHKSGKIGRDNVKFVQKKVRKF